MVALETVRHSSRELSIFFFAHQDDEYGVFASIEIEKRAGRKIVCIYATDGSVTADPSLRDAESKKVLMQLGVAVEDIHFVGRKLDIRDGCLCNYVDSFSNWLNLFILKHRAILSCFIPAWEGGHPDHDILHAMVVSLMAANGKLETIYQYPLYHAKGCVKPLFRVLSPLAKNGYVDKRVICWRDRIRYIRLCLTYRSQWRSWVGLFPFVFAHYMFYGTQQLQPVSLSRLNERPHRGHLYYESRSFMSWALMQLAVDQIPSKVGKITCLDFNN